MTAIDETLRSTVGGEAATVATRAGARRLVLTHLSARYSRDPGEMEREARSVFADVIVAKDGLELDVHYVEP